MARAADDSWDPATGMTATFGAVARAVATNKGLLNDPFAEPLVRAAGVEYFIRVIENERYTADDGDNAVIAGLIDILSAHTRFLDDFLIAAARTGIRQVVILASGLDTRPYRLWWPAGTTLYEIDQPEVVDFKAEVLRGLGAKLTANRCAVGADLGQDWLVALRRVGFDATQRTVWIAEQLLIGYLPPGSQNRLLRDVTTASAAGSRFAADHMATRTPRHGEIARSCVDAWRERGLHVDPASSTYPGEYRDVPRYMEARGWETVDMTVAELFTAVGMARQWPGGPDDAEITPRYVTATRSGMHPPQRR